MKAAEILDEHYEISDIQLIADDQIHLNESDRTNLVRLLKDCVELFQARPGKWNDPLVDIE